MVESRYQVSSNLLVVTEPGQKGGSPDIRCLPTYLLSQSQDRKMVESRYLVPSNLLFVIEPGQEDGGIPGVWCPPTYLFL